MTALRYTLLVWKDFDGCFTARTVDGEDVSATDHTATGAVDQVKQYISWLHRQDRWEQMPDFLEPQLAFFQTPIRPQYRTRQRVFVCRQPIVLRIACVLGRREDRSPVASLPMFGYRFQYHGGDSVQRLVQDYVRRELDGLTSSELSRHLPQQQYTLESFVLNIDDERSRPRQPQVPNLSNVAEPLGDRALRRRFSRAWHRDAEIADLLERLKQPTNLLLVGESGVGKTAVLVDAVRQFERQKPSRNTDETDGSAPFDLSRVRQDEGKNAFQRRFWITNAARLVAGMQYLGQWEQRCEDVIEELEDIGGVLCIENLLELLRVGGDSPESSLAAFFVPYLQRSELRIVAEATPAELDACRRLLPSLVDLFQMVQLPEFDGTTARAVLRQVAESAEQNTRVAAAQGVVDLVYRLFHRFLPYQVFPGKTARFLRELFEQAETEKAAEVTQERALRRFIQQTGLPEIFLRDELPLARSAVMEEFHQHIIGQPAACQTAADLVTTFKAGLNDPRRPLGVLLFCGPTGVGKTELAKTLSKYFFGQGDADDRLIRLDMSEYAGYGAAERMFSQPDGQPSSLIKQLRRQPFVVVLLDEIEKAAPEVFDVLLGLFDEGRLTDRYGRTTVFRSAVIVMTSNLGAQTHSPLGFDPEVQPIYESEAARFFRPEFFNRIDSVVTFHPLDQASIETIARKELTAIAAREGLVKADLRLTWSDDVVRWLAHQGYDARYGARSLQRTLEQRVVTPLSRWLVENADARNTAIRLALDSAKRIVVEV